MFNNLCSKNISQMASQGTSQLQDSKEISHPFKHCTQTLMYI